jgi:tetratricopeptide (TPR) repeat protein
VLKPIINTPRPRLTHKAIGESWRRKNENKLMTLIRNTLLLFWIVFPLFLVAQRKGIIPFRQSRITIPYENNLTIKQADSLIATDPANPDYYDLRAEVYFKLDRMQEAYQDYSKAISLDINEPTFYQHRGILLTASKMPDEAIADFDKAINLLAAKDSIRYHIIGARGNAKAMKMDFQGAYEDYMICFHFDSTDVDALTGLGAVLDDLGREDDAITYLEKGLRLSPNDVGINGNLGYRYMMKGNYEKALFYFNKVLELDPDDARAYNNRGFAYYKLGKYQAALNDVNRSLELFPENAFAFKNRALIFVATKQKDKACIDLGMALTLGFSEMYGNEVEQLKKEHCN